VDFLKRHLFLILCGLFGAGGIVLAVTGISAMPEVVKELENAKTLASNVERAAINPVNIRIIEDKRRRVERVLEDSRNVFEDARALWQPEPLVEDVFPRGDNNARFAFVRAYETKMKELEEEELRATQPPDRQEIERRQRQIEDERAREVPIGVDPSTVRDDSDEGPPVTEAGVLTEVGVRDDPEARESIFKAQNAWCYITPFDIPEQQQQTQGLTPSLYFNPNMKVSENLIPPYLDYIWWAQIEYWIQKSAIDAIKAVNQEAAEELSETGRQKWVATMPVKDIISIRFFSQYVLEDDAEFVGAMPDDFKEALPPGAMSTVFTTRASNRAYDVVQWTIKLVMDQRDINAFLAKMAEGNFHVPLRVAYAALQPNRMMKGKIYGSEPTVIAVIDFETIMLGEVFRPLMPDLVCDNYAHIDCPERPEVEEGG